MYKLSWYVTTSPGGGPRSFALLCYLKLTILQGGTVGDIESMPFVEALTQFRQRAGKGNFVNIHVSYVPVIHGEEKTKPTQHSIRGARQA